MSDTELSLNAFEVPANIEIAYNVSLHAIPSILKRDWKVRLRDREQELLAIKYIQWLSSSNDRVPLDVTLGDITLDDMLHTQNYAKAYIDGKVSFSINHDDISIVKIALWLADLLQSCTSSDGAGITIGIKVATLFSSAVRINFFSSASRCILLRAVQLSNNSSVYKFRKTELFPCDVEERHCKNSNIFDCCYYHENACLLKDVDFEHAFNDLLEKGAILADGDVYNIA